MSPRNDLNTRTIALPPHLAQAVSGLPPELKELVDALPQWLVDVAENSPVYSSRRDGAALVSRYICKMSHRSAEAWPLPWQRVNGRAQCPTIVWLAVAYAKQASAPVVMGGRRPPIEQHVA